MEIERKFLVRGNFRDFALSKSEISQGYLSSVPERNVRIRLRDDQGFLTIKGKSNASGMSRFEWEKEIPVEEAKQLMMLCEPGLIQKTRYIIPYMGHNFEVDEFKGVNRGLIMAELELKSEDEYFQRPPWLGPEVTGDLRFYNDHLSKHPYTFWKNKPKW